MTAFLTPFYLDMMMYLRYLNVEYPAIVNALFNSTVPNNFDIPNPIPKSRLGNGANY